MSFIKKGNKIIADINIVNGEIGRGVHISFRSQEYNNIDIFNRIMFNNPNLRELNYARISNIRTGFKPISLNMKSLVDFIRIMSIKKLILENVNICNSISTINPVHLGKLMMLTSCEMTLNKYMLNYICVGEIYLIGAFVLERFLCHDSTRSVNLSKTIIPRLPPIGKNIENLELPAKFHGRKIFIKHECKYKIVEIRPTYDASNIAEYHKCIDGQTPFEINSSYEKYILRNHGSILNMMDEIKSTRLFETFSVRNKKYDEETRIKNIQILRQYSNPSSDIIDPFYIECHAIEGLTPEHQQELIDLRRTLDY